MQISTYIYVTKSLLVRNVTVENMVERDIYTMPVEIITACFVSFFGDTGLKKKQLKKNTVFLELAHHIYFSVHTPCQKPLYTSRLKISSAIKSLVNNNSKLSDTSMLWSNNLI